MRVLVCGGRTFGARDGEADVLRRFLDDFAKARGVTVVIEGGARGADRLVREWAYRAGLEVRTFPADWARRGKFAGPIRNKRMLEQGRPDVVVAFPGGRGTADMTRKARAAGVEVVKVDKNARLTRKLTLG